MGTEMTWIDDLRGLRNPCACADAIAWAEQSGHATLADAWGACPRGDWMLWLVGRSVRQNSEEHRQLVLALDAFQRRAHLR